MDGAPNPANIFYLLIDHLADADNDNDGRRVEITRMGPFCCVDDGTRGTEYFDTFESRPDPYIGLAWQPGRMRAAKQIQKDEPAMALAAHVRPLTVAQVSEVDQILANLEQTQEGLRLAGMGSPAPDLALPQTLRPEPVSVENTRVVRYTYDPLQRLTDARVGEHFYYHYTYDAVGNRVLEETHAGITEYGYDDANRLTSVDGTPYFWDNNGNLLSDGQRVYSYNHANRLTAVMQGGDAFSFTYNGMGDRLTSTENGVTTEFTLDLNTRLTQVLADGANTYLYGNGRVAQEGAGRAYFLGDALGSVRQLVDQDGQVTLTRNYEPYGEVESSQGAGGSEYGYTGEKHASTLGLVYLRARYLDTVSGMFLSQDTWGGDVRQPSSYNSWLYGFANPQKYTDPTGRVPSILARFTYQDKYFEKADGTPEEGLPEWTMADKIQVHRALWDIAIAYSTTYNNELYRRIFIDCESDIPFIKITPSAAFMYIHGGPITFERQKLDVDYWGYGAEMAKIIIYRKAQFDNKRFVVHEVAHAYENATEHWLGNKPGRGGIKDNLWWRDPNNDGKNNSCGDVGNCGFAGPFDDWQFSRQVKGLRQEENDKGIVEWVDGRGEIFADMFIGWVYNQWESDINGAGWSSKGQERADYMSKYMPGWIYTSINRARGW